jgi:glutamate-ammonia-ligase adenylyltransferase
LAAFGFTDAERTRIAVEELTRGLARSSNLMQQLMPLLLDWLSASPDPDGGLLGLRMLISGFRTPSTVVGVFRDSPESARRLCLLLGTSQMFSRSFQRHPELLRDLGNDKAMVPETPVLERLREALEWRSAGAERLDALIRLTKTEGVRLAAADVIGLVHEEEAARRRTELAEAVLTLVVELLDPKVPVALIGMGRFGGAEMSYMSDIDLIVVHGGTTTDEQLTAEAFARQLMATIANTDPNRRLYAVDYDLRPEGKKGWLARSVESCRQYYVNWAQTWERQALVRARAITGDAGVIQDFFSIVDEIVWNTPLSPDAVREIRMLKARMERERIPRNEDPNFHLKLGPGSLSDVEWTVQLLQLQHSTKGPNTLRSLDRLHDLGHVSDDDFEVLRDAWHFCDRARNRSFLINDAPANAFPAAGIKLTALARSLSEPDVRDIYKKLTRRARLVVERLFYGQNP